ncbi:MAG TPA: hypothetical protein VHQ64_12975, partial [Pyrinomonadaceae bacterium]|nr:hypothetical protein [Pyrinomonadaceae bacterium]
MITNCRMLALILLLGPGLVSCKSVHRRAEEVYIQKQTPSATATPDAALQSQFAQIAFLGKGRVGASAI